MHGSSHEWSRRSDLARLPFICTPSNAPLKARHPKSVLSAARRMLPPRQKPMRILRSMHADAPRTATQDRSTHCQRIPRKACKARRYPSRAPKPQDQTKQAATSEGALLQQQAPPPVPPAPHRRLRALNAPPCPPPPPPRPAWSAPPAASAPPSPGPRCCGHPGAS